MRVLDKNRSLGIICRNVKSVAVDKLRVRERNRRREIRYNGMLILYGETQRAAFRCRDLVGRDAPIAPQLAAVHAPKLKHRFVERHRKHAARQHFGRSDCKGQIKLLACRGRSVAGLNTYDGGLKRIRIRDVDLRRLRKFKRHRLAGLAPHRSRHKRNSRFRHVVNGLNIEHESQKLASTDSDFAAGGRKRPCVDTSGHRRLRTALKISRQSASLHFHRLEYIRIVCERHRKAVRRYAHRIVHRNDDLDVCIRKGTCVGKPNTRAHLDVYCIRRNAL